MEPDSDKGTSVKRIRIDVAILTAVLSLLVAIGTAVFSGLQWKEYHNQLLLAWRRAYRSVRTPSRLITR
jgi:hypothetical protein